MTTEASNEVLEAEARPPGTNMDVAATVTRPDLVWDNEAPGPRQRFARIGTSRTWSLEEARSWAKELRSSGDRGHDPEQYNRERQEIIAVTIAKLPELLGRRSNQRVVNCHPRAFST
jgi:hypothetical protein